MKMIADETKTGWDRVTNIPCVVTGCPGLLRWAEAGYVPGYRICDCCGSHYELVNCSLAEGLRIVRRRRPSPAKVAKMCQRRKQEQRRESAAQQQWLRKKTLEANAQWLDTESTCSHGACVRIPVESSASASGCLIEEIRPPAFAELIRECWTLTRQLSALGSDSISVANATRDGKYVMVYDGPWDGWWDTNALKAAIRNGYPGDGKIGEEQRNALNIWR